MTKTWTRPTCQHQNEDDFDTTAFPVCSHCNSRFPWYQVLPSDVYAHAVEEHGKLILARLDERKQ